MLDAVPVMVHVPVPVTDNINTSINTNLPAAHHNYSIMPPNAISDYPIPSEEMDLYDQQQAVAASASYAAAPSLAKAPEEKVGEGEPKKFASTSYHPPLIVKQTQGHQELATSVVSASAAPSKDFARTDSKSADSTLSSATEDASNLNKSPSTTPTISNNTADNNNNNNNSNNNMNTLLESFRQKNFAEKLHALLSLPAYSTIMQWHDPSNGEAFAIYDTTEFVNTIMSTHFQRAKFDSFTRRMRRWGFRRMESVEEKMKGKVIYKCKLFVRDKPELCKMMCDDRQWKNKERANNNGNGNGNKSPMNGDMILASAQGYHSSASQPPRPINKIKGHKAPVPVHFPTSRPSISSSVNPMSGPGQYPQASQYPSASLSQQAAASQYPHHMAMNHHQSSTMNHQSFAMGVHNMSTAPHNRSSPYQAQEINTMSSLASQSRGMMPAMQNGMDNHHHHQMMANNNPRHNMNSMMLQHHLPHQHQPPHHHQASAYQSTVGNGTAISPPSSIHIPPPASTAIPRSSMHHNIVGGQYQGQEMMQQQHQNQYDYPHSTENHNQAATELTLKYRLQGLKQRRNSLQWMERQQGMGMGGHHHDQHQHPPQGRNSI